MKIYEKPMATISRFDTEDIMTISYEIGESIDNTALDAYIKQGTTINKGKDGAIIFRW